MNLIFAAISKWGGVILDKLPFGQSSKTAELEAETDLELVRKGYIPPKKLLMYVGIAMFVILFFWCMAAESGLFPGMGAMPMKKEILEIIDAVRGE